MTPQNENQYDDAGRKKIMFLAAGILVVLAAVILAFWLFTDRTDASAGNGEAVRITPERIERISSDVSEQVLDTLRADILADMVGDAVTKELTKEKIYKIASENGIEMTAIGDEDLKSVIKELLAEMAVSGDGVLEDGQKKIIQRAVDEALQETLADMDISGGLSGTDRQQIEESLKKELSEMIRNQIQNSSYQFSDQDIERLKRSLNIQSLVNGTVNTAVKQQLEKMKSDILASVKKSVKTPVKGKDYFTDADIKSIQDKVLDTANKELAKQIQSVTSKISEVKSSVSTLTEQVGELKTLDKKKSAELDKLQESITKINTSIQHINEVTEQLTAAITISGSNLEKVTGSGSDIKSSKVSASDLTIAQFVDILAGNGQVYTGAIQELNKIIGQLKDENTKQDEEFDKSLKELESSLGDNGKKLEESKAALEQSDKELKDQMDRQEEDFQQKMEEEQKQREEEDAQEQKQREEADAQEQTQREEADTKEQAQREEADEELQKQLDAVNELAGQPEEAGKIEGETIFQKIGSIVSILSKDGLDGLFEVLQNIGGAQTVEEGMDHLNTDLTDARTRVGELEKEKWLSNITLLAQAQQDSISGYAYQESGSAYVYQIPLVTEEDRIQLSDDDTSIVVEFKKPGKLPSNVALSVSGNVLLIAFTNRPSRNIDIVSIHVYKEK